MAVGKVEVACSKRDDANVYMWLLINFAKANCSMVDEKAIGGTSYRGGVQSHYECRLQTTTDFD